MFSIGIDIGGTFTDFCVYRKDTGQVSVHKSLTTPDAPERAVMEGLEFLYGRSGLEARDARRLVHATTLVTNAILERKGAKTALITTRGFRDVLETGLEMRYNVYDLFLEYPEPIVPRWLRFGLDERLYPDGAVRTPLDEADLERIVAQIEGEDISAVAVCLIHAYSNPEHEIRVGDYIRKRLPGVHISLSHEVNPQPREYERTSTTVLDAYVKPTVARYLDELGVGLAGKSAGAPLQIMLSNGGTTTTEVAQKYPIQMIESGPAAGVEAAIWVCRQHGISDALSFDMGGTTAKLCVLREGRAARSRSFEAGRVHRFVPGSGMPVVVPVYDLVEIGAGGGSIARIDGLGLVAVGPDSAGAAPGPACYGRGGASPTVTDADLVLGHLGADSFLGGNMTLDAEASRTAFASVADPLGLTVEEAAWGVCQVVDETMASAARLHISEKGADPSRLTVVAFGGAGPVHAIELARKLGCPTVLYPAHAGVMSSFGLLTAPPAFERLVSVKRLLGQIEPGFLRATAETLSKEVAEVMGEPVSAVSFRFLAEMWHRGQEYPIEVEFSESDFDDDLAAALLERFTERYAELYGRTDDELPHEISVIRAIGTSAHEGIASIAADAGVPSAGASATRILFDAAGGAMVEVPVYMRADLAVGQRFTGPAIIQDTDSAAVIRAGDKATVLPTLAIEIRLAASIAGEAA